MTPIKRNLNYIFRDSSLLRLRVRWNSTEVLVLPVGYHVDKTDVNGKIKWDGSRCRLNTTHGLNKIPAATINQALENIEKLVDDAFLIFEKQDIMPTKNQLKAVIKNGGGVVSFFGAFDEFIKEGKELLQWSVSTQRKLSTLRTLLFQFSQKLKFSDITHDMLKQFMAYQTEHAVAGKSQKEIESGKKIIKYKGKYQNCTINRNVKNLKWFMTWAANKGYHDNKAIFDYKVKYKTSKRPVVFLKWDELMRIMDLDLKLRPEFEKVRDMFCFCCFTSLRYSDLANLRWSNVSEDSITITTIKTTDTIIIDLNDYSKEIIDKYKGIEHSQEDYVFSKKSSQKMNKNLKEIGKMAGIDSPVQLIQLIGSERKDIIVPKYELLSTHCGRRTFICNALSLGIPPNVIMKWTGHSDYKAMQPYIEIADEVRKESMAKFNFKK